MDGLPHIQPGAKFRLWRYFTGIVGISVRVGVMGPGTGEVGSKGSIRENEPLRIGFVVGLKRRAEEGWG